MVNILLVEDDPIKESDLRKCINSVGGIDQRKVVVARDMVSARDALTRNYFDVMILDIRLPNVAGDDIEDGGVSLIKELRTSTTLIKPSHIIGITAYDDAVSGVGGFFEEEVWILIKYDPSVTKWDEQLRRKLAYLVRSKQELETATGKAYLYDIAIVTALHDPELRAVLHLSAGWTESTSNNDSTVYHIGAFSDVKKTLKVVAAAAPQMGMPAAAVLASKVINQFRPRYLVMLGIAAGMPGDGRSLGDIMVAERCWNYEAGKRGVNAQGDPVFIPEPTQVALNTALRETFLNVKAKNLFLGDIQHAWQGAEVKTKLSLDIGPVASGSAVVADKTYRDGIKDQQQRKLIGIEMEGYAVYYTAENCPKPQPIPMMIKSVVDFATIPKEDTAHRYAAYTSAQFFYRFALAFIDPLYTSDLS
jgi:nucleoside phosphorylase/CheY-like chemotaxis protein